jgi:hypothetical protein
MWLIRQMAHRRSADPAMRGGGASATIGADTERRCEGAMQIFDSSMREVTPPASPSRALVARLRALLRRLTHVVSDAGTCDTLCVS